jgi:hypothetical protein
MMGFLQMKIQMIFLEFLLVLLVLSSFLHFTCEAHKFTFQEVVKTVFQATMSSQVSEKKAAFKTPPPPPIQPSLLATPQFKTSDVPQDSGTPQVSNITAISSCVGGVIDDGHGGEAWVGGSNINPPLIPIHFGQCCPSKYASAFSVQETCKKGIGFKLAREDEASTISFMTWIELLSKTIEENGMDTVFRVPNHDWTAETFILVEWGKAKASLITPWINEIRIGITNASTGEVFKPCPYDQQALNWSAHCILNSLSDTLRSDVVASVGINASGPEIFVSVISKKLQLVVSIQHNLIKQLEAMSVAQEEGENVETFNKKLKGLIKKIEGVGPAPPDLPRLVIETFMSCQVTIFNTEVNRFFLELTKDHTKYTCNDILSELESLYITVKDWMWSADMSRKINKKEFANIQKQANKLTIKLSGKEKKDKVFCWDCGKQGECKGHDGCTQSGKRLHKPKTAGSNGKREGDKGKKPGNKPYKKCEINGKHVNATDPPAEGASEVRTLDDGTKQKFCKTCKRWKSGKKAHVTEDHRPKGSDPSKTAISSTCGVCIAETPGAFAVESVTPTGKNTSMLQLVPAKHDVGVVVQDEPTGALALSPGLMCFTDEEYNNDRPRGTFDDDLHLSLI